MLAWHVDVRTLADTIRNVHTRAFVGEYTEGGHADTRGQYTYRTHRFLLGRLASVRGHADTRGHYAYRTHVFRLPCLGQRARTCGHTRTLRLMYHGVRVTVKSRARGHADSRGQYV
eukprot:5156295-Pyramimonas_sp.AAC.1